MGISGDEDEDKYSPVGTGMEAKTLPHALRGGERGSFLRTFSALISLCSISYGYGYEAMRAPNDGFVINHGALIAYGGVVRNVDGLQLVKDRGFMHIEVESDSSSAVSLISNGFGLRHPVRIFDYAPTIASLNLTADASSVAFPR
ncbi:hypothetical protein L195_g046550, partial [Trifolium pratense]